MPKILINEKDKTSPGTPGSYANYSVLIAGYKGTPATGSDAVIINPDSNGVYEFSSKQAFEDTIGIAEVEVKDDQGKVTEAHYGNRMAYELLNLGYNIIYRPIDSVLDMNTEAFWEIFKDKASYDFRFVSHGLLATSYDAAEYDRKNARLSEIEADIKKLAELTATVKAGADFDKLDAEAQAEVLNEAYSNVIRTVELGGEGYTGFRQTAADGTKGLAYASYADAAAMLMPNLEGDIPAYVAQKTVVDSYDDTCVTPTTFNNINGHITKLARYLADDKAAIPGRGDCIALIELDENCYVATTTTKPENLIIDGINNMSSSIADDGAYCALTVPSVNYKMSGEVKKFPGAFHYLACFMSSLRAGFAEWYAIAGYTRGVSSYVIDHTSVKLGEIAINALEPRNLVDDPAKIQPVFACNVIANFRGSYYLWGNRTAHKLGAAAGGNDLVAHHFLNIRQLCTTIKKQLYVACRRFTFDPNSDTLWFNFVNAITPTLDAMKADQGVRDYKILKVFTDKKATLKAKIRIIPIEAVEDFDLEISLEDSFGETSAVVTE